MNSASAFIAMGGSLRGPAGFRAACRRKGLFHPPTRALVGETRFRRAQNENRML